MDYTAHTKEELESIFAVLGITSLEDLFSELPSELLGAEGLQVEKGLSELEVLNRLRSIAKKNISLSDYTCFLGAGIYDHYIPSAVDSLASRGEFYTSYTPYQAEASQGSLMAMMEYQSAIARLTGMDISNASLYEGSSALAEAILMALSITGKREVILSKTLHPEWIEVAKTYLDFQELHFLDSKEGESDWESLDVLLSENTACICIQSPNFYGVIEDYRFLRERIGDTLLIVASYPFSLGFLEAPGNWGADIVVGDGQSIGNYPALGGPQFGFLACKEEYIRKIPGRIVGQTYDATNQRAFCLTFQAREQHIRRQKATSNICTNQALLALRAILYLACIGEKGLKHASYLAYHKAHYLQKRICNLAGFSLGFSKPFFNEFVIRSPIPIEVVNRALFQKKILGSVPLERFGHDSHLMLIAVTEKRTKEEMDLFLEVLSDLA